MAYDDWGDLAVGAAMDHPGATMAAYQTGKRVAPFVEGAVRSAAGAAVGRDVAALGASVARGVATTAAVAAGGAEGGAMAGAALGPAGMAAGAALGAIAPHILPHIPIVGEVVNKIPLIGGILSPKQHKERKSSSQGGASTNPFVAAAAGSDTLSGADYSKQQRAEYQAGRGFS